MLTLSPDDRDVVIRTLYGEARGEPLIGQEGVVWVIRNRVEWPGGPHWWGATAGQICQRPWQFSCWNQNDSNLAKLQAISQDDPEYLALGQIVDEVMGDQIDDPTGHASHYVAQGISAAWIEGRTPSAILGNQDFYSVGP